MTRVQDPPTEPIPAQRDAVDIAYFTDPAAEWSAAEPLPEPSVDRWPSRRALRVTWALFALAVLAFYAVPIGAAAGWW